MVQTAVESANTLVDIAVKTHALVTAHTQKQRLTKLIPRLQTFAVYTRNLAVDLVYYNGSLHPSLLESLLSRLAIRALSLKQFFISYEHMSGEKVEKYLHKSLIFLVGRDFDDKSFFSPPRRVAPWGIYPAAQADLSVKKGKGSGMQSEWEAMEPITPEAMAALGEKSKEEFSYIKRYGLYTYFNSHKSLEARDEIVAAWIKEKEASLRLVVPNALVAPVKKDYASAAAYTATSAATSAATPAAVTAEFSRFSSARAVYITYQMHQLDYNTEWKIKEEKKKKK